MLKNLILTPFLILFFLSSVKGNQNDFWKYFLQADYENAAKTASILGAEYPEYYLLAAISYHNLFDYEKHALYRNTFHRTAKDMDETSQFLKEHEKQHQNTAQMQLLMGLAKNFEPKLNLEDSENYFKKSIALKSVNPFAYNYLSMIESIMGNYQKSIEYAQKSINQMPSLPEAYNNLAYGTYTLTEDTDKTVDILLNCLENCPKSPPNTYYSLIAITTQQGMLTISPNGQTMLISAPFFPDDSYKNKISSALKPYPHHYLGFCNALLDQGAYLELQGLLDAFTPTAQTESFYNYLLSTIAYNFGNNERADSLSQIVISNEYHNYRHIFELGINYYNRLEYNKAIDYFNNALTYIDDLDFEYKLKIYANIGACYLGLEQNEKAIENFKTALIYDPQDVITYLNLGLVYQQLDKKEFAKMYYEKAKANSTDKQTLDYIETKLTELK